MMNNLRNLRKAKGYTIKQLSESTGFPTRTIEDWEYERRQIMYYHRLKRLCDILDCDMDSLMTKKEKCVYDGNNAVMWLVQEDDGVHIEITDNEEISRLFKSVKVEDEELKLSFKGIIPRKQALELLSYMKEHKEVKQYLTELNRNET